MNLLYFVILLFKFAFKNEPVNLFKYSNIEIAEKIAEKMAMPLINGGVDLNCGDDNSASVIFSAICYKQYNVMKPFYKIRLLSIYISAKLYAIDLNLDNIERHRNHLYGWLSNLIVKLVIN